MTDPLGQITALSVTDFSASHWGVAPLVRRAADLPGDGFTGLLSLAGVDELVSRRGLRTPFIRMTRNGDVLPPQRYTAGGGAGAEIADQVADEKVLAEFAAGATLVLQALHRIWPPVQQFAHALSSQLGHPVQVNAYLTPPQNTGFAPHYDVHDVFVLQFAGSKRWRIHEPVWSLPLRDQPWTMHKADVAARAAEVPHIDTVLAPGDALYLPRGYIHAATSLGDVSGHLTVGVHPLTRQTVAAQLLGSLAADVELRRALPLGVDLTDAAVLDAEVDATIAALHRAIDALDRGVVAHGIRTHLAAAIRPAPLQPLAQAALAAALGPDTRVRLRPGLRVALRREGAEMVLALPERDVPFPLASGAALRAAISGDAVAAQHLPEIDAAAGTALIAQLLRHGVVVPA